MGRAVSDEFQDIARRFRPLTFGAPEALDLMDDAAVIPSRPGFDLVVTKDALVEGVHFLSGERPDRIARKLLRTNLSDLAAKGAEPYGCFLAVSWPPHYDAEARDQFERQYLIRVLQMTEGNVTRAAELAGRNRTDFYKLLKKHELSAAQITEQSDETE